MATQQGFRCPGQTVRVSCKASGIANAKRESAKRLRPHEEANRRNGPKQLFPTQCTFRKSIDEDNHVVEAELFRVQVGGEPRAAADIEEMMWMRVEEARGRVLAALTRDSVVPLVLE